MGARLTDSLGERLKAATKDLHRAVERGPFMQALLSGRLDRGAYALLLRNLHALYRALETAMDEHAQHPAVLPLRLPGLPRVDALARDAQHLHGPAWQDELQELPATSRYRLHLQQLSAQSPQRLAAHAYVRYLGDLSGGQLLEPIVVRSLKLQAEGGRGSAFYNFGSVAVADALAASFRAGLDQAGARLPDQGAAIVDEAQWAFEMHRALFDELALACGIEPAAAAAADHQGGDTTAPLVKSN